MFKWLNTVVCFQTLNCCDMTGTKYSLNKLKNLLGCVEYLDKNAWRADVYENYGSPMLYNHRYFLEFEICRIENGDKHVAEKYPRISWDQNYWYKSDMGIEKISKKTFKCSFTDLYKLPVNAHV